MLITNSNLEQIAETIERFLSERLFTLVIYRQSRALGSVQVQSGHRLLNPLVECSPPMSGAYPRWLSLKTSLGPLVLPATRPDCSLEEMQASQIFLQESRLVLSSYSVLSGRFLRWDFLRQEPSQEIPHLLSIGDLPTVERPVHLAARSPGNV